MKVSLLGVGLLALLPPLALLRPLLQSTGPVNNATPQPSTSDANTSSIASRKASAPAASIALQGRKLERREASIGRQVHHMRRARRWTPESHAASTR